MLAIPDEISFDGFWIHGSLLQDLTNMGDIDEVFVAATSKLCDELLNRNTGHG
jgi:hypothetical protein